MVGGKMIDSEMPDKESRIKRFQTEYLDVHKNDDDSDDSVEELNLAEKMFFDDITKIRRLVAEKMLECMHGEFKVRDLLTEKTTYFMNEIE
jgi:hypothetical protein